MRLIDADAMQKNLCENADLLIDAWGSFDNLPEKDKARVDEIFNCVAEVVNAPTIDAVPVVHGRWITEDADTGELGAYSAFLAVKCSECDCDYSAESGQYGWYLGDPFPYHYCPNCGAKMDLEVDGDG